MMVTQPATPGESVTGPGRHLVILLIADPGAPASLGRAVARSLPDQLAGRTRTPYDWEVVLRVEPYLPHEYTPFLQVIETVDPGGKEADVVIYLTDLPRRDHTMPVIADISVEHRFALISIAGVGPLFISRHVADLVALAVAHIIDEPGLVPSHAARLPSTQIDGGLRYFAPKGLRRLRLLLGMVHANRPWQLVLGLSRALVGAFASGAAGLATNTIWQFADTMAPWRMAAGTVLSIAAMVTWLIVDHELWERPESPTERDRAVLYNVSTLITLTIGVAVLHVALFCTLLFTTALVLTPQLFSRTIGHPVGVLDYLKLAWLLASIATIGGALGSGLEDDDAVKSAAYGVRQRQRFDKPD
ncbi:MAG: hypothetical protein QOE41_949 [Mycobacterium sp.]|jgi:hypothetical protein|nr:hypothetical protein [Mycobacterium sp.]MDT5131638.1 hypothetical protein [Mycobacterium sp.]